MFNTQNVGERGGSRPFIVGLVLLLLFLSTTQDWSSPAPRNASRKQLRDSSQPEITSDTKEKIISKLLRSNAELEKENNKLLIEIDGLKSELRKRPLPLKTNLTEEGEQDDTSSPNVSLTLPSANVSPKDLEDVASDSDEDVVVRTKIHRGNTGDGVTDIRTE